MGKAISSPGGLFQPWTLVALYCPTATTRLVNSALLRLVKSGRELQVGETYLNPDADNDPSRGSLARVPAPALLLASVILLGICPFPSSPDRDVEPLTSLCSGSTLSTHRCALV